MPPRLLRLAALALCGGLASCDSGEPAAGFAGTWIHTVTEERLTVTSGVEQTYRSYDAEAQDGIGVNGRSVARLRYTTTPFHADTPDTLVLEDRCPEASRCESAAGTALTLSRGRLVLDIGAESGGPTYEVNSEAITFSVSGGVLTVPRIEVPTPGGFVQIGGTLTIREVALAPGTAAPLPARPFAFGTHALTLNEDGSAVRLAASGAEQTGRWEAEGDRLRVTLGGETATYDAAVANGGLVLVARDAAPDLRRAERERGLAPGSLTAASRATVARYVRFAP